MSDTDMLLNQNQVAERLGVVPNTVLVHVRAGRLVPAQVVGRVKLFTADDVDAFEARWRAWGRRSDAGVPRRKDKEGGR